MDSLADNLARIEDQIAAACRAANRPRAEIELMAVSKTYSAEIILEAISLGLTLFGENRVQEFASKSHTLTAHSAHQTTEVGCPIHPAAPSPDGWEGTNAAQPDQQPTAHPALPRFHLIGHLQSNKAARAVELFHAVDTVHSLKLAERLDDAAGKLGKRLPILLEVKLSPEETKEGLDPESRDAAELLERLPDLAHLEARGLMTIAPWGAPEAVTRACFRSLRTLRHRWAAAHPRLPLAVLSMGMSGDFPLAIAEGATRIRIGTALFGKRNPPSQPARVVKTDHS